MNNEHMNPTQRVLNALAEGGNQATRSGKGWSARCPAHDDRNPSLSISEGSEGKALVHCHAGCGFDDIVEAIGLGRSDLYQADSGGTGHRPPRPSSKATGSTSAHYGGVCEAMAVLESRLGTSTHTWEYHDAQGELVGVVVRFDTHSGKSFRPISKRVDQNGEYWCIEGMEAPRPLYALRDVIDSVGPVYVCEGEKACDAAIRCGLIATTSANGSKSASKSDWSALRGREVLIVPDHDDAGERYAEEVKRLVLEAGALSVRVIRLADQWTTIEKGGDMDDVLMMESGDVVAVREGIESLVSKSVPIDTLKEPCGADGLNAVRKNAAGSPVLVSMGDVQPEEVHWLWKGRLPLGRLSVLVGRPGEGKSFATTDWAARVSTGSDWPDGSSCPKGSVLLVSAEDDPGDTIRPRLDAHQADPYRVHLLRGVHATNASGSAVEGAFTLADIDTLRDALVQIGDVKLIVIDPIGSYMGGKVDAHRDNEVRGVLAPLGALAQEWGVAVVLVAHQRKGGASHADDMVLGSRAFTGIARSVLHLMRDPDDEDRRVLLPGKMNLSIPAPGLGFTIAGTPGSVQWDTDPVTLSASEVLGRSMGQDNQSSAQSDACNWLRDVLSDGPQPASELRERANDDGIAWRTIERAKKAIGALSQREGYSSNGRWVWLMPIDRHSTPTVEVPEFDGVCPK
jgi:putative DNA primase/helicase